jgi:hypothetical protein
MPSVFGVLMFALLPFPGRSSMRGWQAEIISAMMLTAAAVNALAAPGLHREGRSSSPPMLGLRQGISLLREAAAARSTKRINFASVYVGQLHYLALNQFVQFELGGTKEGGGVRDVTGFLFTSDEAHRFTPAVAVDWQTQTVGATDEVARLAGEKFDCLFIPDDATAVMLERDRSQRFMNAKLRAVKRALLNTGLWERHGPLLDFRSNEKVEFYRHVKRR